MKCFSSLRWAILAITASAALARLTASPVKDAQSVPTSTTGSIIVDSNGKLAYISNYDSSAVAYGTYEDGSAPQRTSGFGRLRISTSAQFSDSLQMRAAGYLEAVLTRDRIAQHFQNWNWWVMQQLPGYTTLPSVMQQWFNTQDAWVRNQISQNKSAMWESAGLIMNQFDGLIEGYQAHAEPGKELSKMDLIELNAVGDLIDLISALMPQHAPKWESMKPHEVMDEVHKRSHCSGLIKVTGDLSEMFAGHSSWFSYVSMLRIYKHYEFNVGSSVVAAKTVSFSSYPGLLSSLDDFYMMKETKLVMVQTTNSILDNSIYKYVTSKSLLAWQRVRSANQMATGGKEWADILAYANSGTYNNQYMIVDYKLFTPKKALKPNTLWVTEQIPGLVVAADVTQQLERGYWPSYNVPYFPEIYNRSGYPAMIARHPEEEFGALAGLNYQLAPRAKIFRRDQGKVVDMDTYKNIMRSNDYKTDPYSNHNPWDAICSRGDLAGQLSGCYDSKVTSSEYISSQTSFIINGPTRAQNTLPAFSWSEFDGKYMNSSHVGLFETYDFNFQEETLV